MYPNGLLRAKQVMSSLMTPIPGKIMM